MAEDLSLKLYYFDITGKGEPIRLLLHYLGIAFEDYRFENREEFADMKQSGKLMFGQVPALEVTNKKDNSVTMLNQTSAILRYVAKLGGTENKSPYPSDAILAAKVDAITDQETDCFTGVKVASYKGRFGFGFLEEHKELADGAIKNQKEAVIPGHLGLLVKQLEDSTTGWIAGTEGPSIAEFTWMPALKWFSEEAAARGGNSVIDVDKFPKIKEWMEKFDNLSEIKEWRAKHTK